MVEALGAGGFGWVGEFLGSDEGVGDVRGELVGVSGCVGGG